MAKKKCKICGLSDANELDYGEWMTKDNCTVHQFCLFFSSDMRQNGADDEGIDGFLVEDIEYLCRSYAKTECRYCRKPRATVRCCEPNCIRIFHVICGVKRKCLFKFADQFDAYCHMHSKIDEKFDKHGNDSNCMICFDAMGEYHAITSIPSCCNQGYFHKKCIQTSAITCGYKMHCPMCGYDADGYRKFLSNRGIYCPNKDAGTALLMHYLTEENPYDSLLRPRKRCDAEVCCCPNGRDYVGEEGEWFIQNCSHCNDIAMHVGCLENASNGRFNCQSCTEIILKVKGQSLTDTPSRQSVKTSVNDQKDTSVWKMLPSKMVPFRKRTLYLMSANEELIDFDPLDRDQRKSMRDYRLKMFMAKADVDSKPPPLPWIV